ncbi:MAG: hypothetical protein WKF48_09615 [Solirubrobacteraceae bacterium]
MAITVAMTSVAVAVGPRPSTRRAIPHATRPTTASPKYASTRPTAMPVVSSVRATTKNAMNGSAT